jgi:tRNA pseudouridine synthase
MSVRCAGVFDFGPPPAQERWVRVELHGQSFLMNQIRKMVGMALAVYRGVAPRDGIEIATDPQRNFGTPMAPELGLLLVECCYSAHNSKLPPGCDELSLADWAPRIERFKQARRPRFLRTRSRCTAPRSWRAARDSCTHLALAQRWPHSQRGYTLATLPGLGCTPARCLRPALAVHLVHASHAASRPTQACLAACTAQALQAGICMRAAACGCIATAGPLAQCMTLQHAAAATCAGAVGGLTGSRYLQCMCGVHAGAHLQRDEGARRGRGSHIPLRCAAQRGAVPVLQVGVGTGSAQAQAPALAGAEVRRCAAPFVHA